MNSALSSKKKSSCKWPIMKKKHSPLFRWVGVSGNIQGSGCLPFSKGSRKYSWKANGTRLFQSFRQKKISGGNGTSEKLVVFFRTEQGALATTTATGNEDVKKALGLYQKTTTLHVHHPFLYISLPSLHDYDAKMRNCKFFGGRKQATTNLFFSL